MEYSYIASSLAFLFMLLVISGLFRSTYPGRTLLITAISGSFAWATLLGLQALTQSLPTWIIFLAESVRNTLWLALLISLIVTLHKPAYGQKLYWALTALVIVISAMALWNPDTNKLTVINGDAMIYGGLFSALFGLLLIEQLYRNSNHDQRWGIKYLCLGLAALFLFDLVLYTNTVLYNHINPQIWSARGISNALIVPLLIIGITRSPKWSSQGFVSRQVVFFSTSLFLTGLMLLLIAGGGYYIRLYNSQWGTYLQALLFFSAGLGAATLVFSGRVRARLKVFISKHFYENKYDYRSEWLRLLQRLVDDPKDIPIAKRALFAVAQTMESKGGAIWTNNDNAFQLAAQWNLDIPKEAHTFDDGTLANYLERTNWVIDMTDSNRSHKHHVQPPLPNWMKSLHEIWLIIPLKMSNTLQGILLLSHSRAQQTLSYEDYDLLKAMGAQIASYLALDKTGTELTEAKQFEAFNRLNAYLMHDIKNLIAQLSLVVDNATRHKNNPEFVEDAFKTIDHSVQRMSRLLKQLKRNEQELPVEVELNHIIQDVLKQCAQYRPVPQFTPYAGESTVRVEPDRLAMVLHHLIRNAQQATPDEGVVHISLNCEHEHASITIEDNGSGMDTDFVENRLFKPFDSTKGSQGMGIGVYESREFLQSAGGALQVISEIGKGSQFKIRLPSCQSTDTSQENAI